MKLLHREISAKDGEGSVTLLPEEPEDLWHIYNILATGDKVRCSTMRKVMTQTNSTISAARKRFTVTVQIVSIAFDPQDDNGTIRVNGRNVEQNQHMKLGAHHTVELEVNRKCTLFKDSWDVIAIERLEEACDPVKKASIAAVVLQAGLAHVCLITDHMTIVRSKIEQSIPKKRGDSSNHKKALTKFYNKVMQALLRHVDFKDTIIKCILIAGPGFVKDDFFAYMMSEAQKQELKDLLRNKSMFVLCHASSGYKHSLEQVLKDPLIQDKLADTKAYKETKALNQFMQMLNADSDRAFYSYKHVQAALERNAIETLLLSDSLFRAQNIKTRKVYVKLVEDCREAGCEVLIFSALHVSGKQLEQMSGVAAILRFPLHEIHEQEIDFSTPEVAVEDNAVAQLDDDQANADARDMGFS